jgi:hypothetical protein
VHNNGLNGFVLEEKETVWQSWEKDINQVHNSRSTTTAAACSITTAVESMTFCRPFVDNVRNYFHKTIPERQIALVFGDISYTFRLFLRQSGIHD